MRRMTVLLSVVVAALVIASGVALAKDFQGDGKNNRLVGTNKADTIAGSGGDDNISGKGGRDRLYGDSGRDKVSGGKDRDDVFGGKGADNLFGNDDNDYINSADNRGADVVDCGPGYDSAVVDFFGESVVDSPDSDIVDFQNCEDVTTVITNPGTGTHSQDVANLQRDEVDDAVAAGLLERVN